MKTTRKILPIVLAMLCAFMCCFLVTQTVNAASVIVTHTPSIENITMLDAHYGVIELELDKSALTNKCAGFEIEVSTSSGFKVDCQKRTIDSTHDDIDGIYLIPNKTYYFRVRGFIGSEYTNWSSIKTFSYDLTMATFTRIQMDDTRLHVEWEGMRFNDDHMMFEREELDAPYGCVIEYSPSSTFDYDVKTIYEHDASEGMITIENTLEPNQRYYFRIRSFVNINGKVYYQAKPVCQTTTYKLEPPIIEKYGVTDSVVAVITKGNEYYDDRYLNLQISDSRNFDVILHDELIIDSEVADAENKLQPGKQYYARVRYAVYRSYEENYEDIEELIYGDWSVTIPISYNTKDVIIRLVKAQGNNVDIGWDPIDRLNWYEIQYTQSNSFEGDATIVSGESNHGILENLAPGAYIARVRAFEYKKVYETENNAALKDQEQYVKCYSDWSESVKFVVAPAATRLDAIKLSDKNITFNWNGVDGCSGYEIRYGTSADFTNCKTVKIPNKTAISEKIINDLIPNTRYYFSIRSYCTGYGITEYSAWSNVMKATYRPTKTYIKHLTLGGDQSVVVDWKTLDYCDGYQIQYAYDNTFKNAKTVDVKDASEIETHINGLLPGVCYFRIRTIITINDVDYYSDWSNTKNIEFKFTKTYLTNQLVEDNVIKITWKAVNGDVYEIQYAKDEKFTSAKTTRLDNIEETTDKLSYTINDDTLTPGTYYIRIRVIQNVDGKEYAADWSNAKTVNYKLTKTYIKTLSITNGQMKVDWKTVDKIAGYQIQYGSDKNLTNGQMLNILGSEVDNCAINDYAPGACYVRIRTYKTIGNQTYYSDWSNIKNVSTQLTKTYITNQFVKNGKAVVAWKTTNDCEGYEVQTATNEKFQNAKTTTVAGSTIDRCEGLTINQGTNYLRVRTYKTINGVKYYSDWSNAKTLTVQ